METDEINKMNHIAELEKRLDAQRHDNAVLGVTHFGGVPCEAGGILTSGKIPMPNMNGPARISTRELLHQRAAEFRRKAEALDRLAHALPAGLAHLDAIADDFLFELVSNLPRVR